MKRFLLAAVTLLAFFSASLHAQYTTNYRLGYQAYTDGDYETALQYFERDLTNNPHSGLSLLMCATIYGVNGDYARSQRAATDALKYLDKKDKQSTAMAYAVRGYAYCFMGDTIPALKDYDKAFKLDASYTFPTQERIKIYIAQEDYEKAYKVCDQLVAADRTNEEAYIYYAAVYMLDNKPEQAIEKTTTAIQMNPRNPKNYAYRAQQFCMTKNYNRAADDVEQYFALGGNGSDVDDIELTIRDCPSIVTKLQGVLNRDPQNVGAAYLLSTLQQRDDQWLAAARTLGRSYQQAPAFATTYYIARDLERAGLYELAGSWCEACLASDTTNSVAPLLLSAEIAHARGNYDTALTAISDYIYATRNAIGYYYRGWIYSNLKRPNDACADYTTCIGLEPDYAYAYIERAKQYLTLGDHTKANADFRRVIELEDTVSEPSCLQYAYHHLGNDQRATEIMQRVLTAEPDAGNYYDAACLYSLMGQQSEALGYFEISMAKGYRDFNHIQEDSDLDAIRNTDRFKSIISDYRNIYAQEQQQALSYPELIPPTYAAVDSVAPSTEEVAEPYAPVGGGNISIASVDYAGDISSIAPNGEALDNAIVEVQAQYPGGEAALLKFIAENLVYPAIAAEKDLQGVVILRFRVEKDGSIGEIRIVKSLSPECDRAAANVVKKLRHFIPARQKGKPVPVWFILPIRFSIQ